MLIESIDLDTESPFALLGPEKLQKALSPQGTVGVTFAPSHIRSNGAAAPSPSMASPWVRPSRRPDTSRPDASGGAAPLLVFAT